MVVPADFMESMRAAVRELGPPLYGLDGPLAREGVLAGHGGRPCTQVTARYRTDEYEIEVTTSQPDQSHMRSSLMDLVVRAAPWGAVEFPWTLTVDESEVTLTVDGEPTAFRRLSTSTGQWLAEAQVDDRCIPIADVTSAEITIADFQTSMFGGWEGSRGGLHGAIVESVEGPKQVGNRAVRLQLRGGEVVQFATWKPNAVIDAIRSAQEAQQRA